MIAHRILLECRMVVHPVQTPVRTALAGVAILASGVAVVAPIAGRNPKINFLAGVIKTAASASAQVRAAPSGLHPRTGA